MLSLCREAKAPMMLDIYYYKHLYTLGYRITAPYMEHYRKQFDMVTFFTIHNSANHDVHVCK